MSHSVHYSVRQTYTDTVYCILANYSLKVAVSLLMSAFVWRHLASSEKLLRMFQEYFDSSVYASRLFTMSVLDFLYSNEGIEGFYKGMVPNLVRVIPACCITFLVFENVSRLLLGEYH